MANTTAFAGEKVQEEEVPAASRAEIYDSALRLFGWLESNEYRGYDTFDGLSAKVLSSLTFENKYLRIALQQGVRRFPINLRPMFGIKKAHSSKGMGFLARGFMRLGEATGDQKWDQKARFCLEWLMEHKAVGYSGACWGNHFDYQSRTGRIPKGMPTVVWTSLIGHAFLDGYEHFQDDKYLQVAISICEHITCDLRIYPEGEGVCINYTPGGDSWVHNANTLGGSFLARTYAYTKTESFRKLARMSLQYTAQHQLPNGSWFYGAEENQHWVDNFHTGYVLDCFKHYRESTGDDKFDAILEKGYRFWKETFFLANGIPRYYDRKTLPLDIQCSSQAIDTLVFFSDQDDEAIDLALKVAKWTIRNMQDRSGYFYYRRYSRWLVNKTPTLHWGQATMLCALGGLYKQLNSRARGHVSKSPDSTRSLMYH
jgi:polysaccharide biosynthesis protein VpsJ